MWSLRGSLILALMVSLIGGFAQQDLIRNQYMYDLYLANPAFAGNEQGLSTTLTYRKQWAGFTGAPETQTLTIHAPTKGGRSGLGIAVLNDKIGARTVTSITGTYSYRVRLGTGKLSFGLDLGMLQNKYDLSQIDYQDQGDPIVQKGRENNVVANIDAGLLYYTRSTYIGLSAYHLSSSKYDVYDASESRQYMHIIAIAGHAFDLNDRLVLMPTTLFRGTETGQFQFDLNVELKIAKVLGVVAGYRFQYGAMAMVYVNVKEKLRIGYSYDLPMNKLSTHASGSHEAFISYDFDIYKRGSISPRTL